MSQNPTLRKIMHSESYHLSNPSLDLTKHGVQTLRVLVVISLHGITMAFVVLIVIAALNLLLDELSQRFDDTHVLNPGLIALISV